MMLKKIKHFILNNDLLIKLISILLEIVYFPKNRTIKIGKNNKVSRPITSIYKNVKLKIRGKNNIIKFGDRCRFRKLNIQVSGENNQIIISKSVMFYENGKILIEGNNCSIKIGANSTIGSAKIYAGESNTSIEIGEDCMLSRNIRINTSDFHSIFNLETGKRINLPKNVIISNHVWIGFDAVISPGSIISSNSIVASRSLVNKAFLDENILLVGTPAKIVKTNVGWTRDKLDNT